MYEKLLGLENATFSLIDHEDAMVALVYKINQCNGKEFILKILPRYNDYFREVYFLKHFANVLPVPKIIQLIEPSENIHGAILMECLPGALLEIEKFTDTLAYDIGSMLAKIHLNRVSNYGDPIILDSLDFSPKSYFTLKFKEGLDECNKHLPEQLIKKCYHYFEDHLHLLNLVDGPCIVHRDFRPGNLMVCRGKLAGIIDWAGARLSFAEEDFCSLEHGEWPVNNKKYFLDGYASVRSIPNYVNLMPFLRLNKAIASIGFTIKTGTWKGKNSKLYQFNRQFIDNFF